MTERHEQISNAAAPNPQARPTLAHSVSDDYSEQRCEQDRSIPARARLLLIVDEEWW